MIRNDDTRNYARVKAWREKNRERYNLYQRNYRKGITASSSKAVEHPCEGGDSGSTPEPQTFTTKKVGELRMIVMPEQEKPRTEVPHAKPVVFRNDYGAVITESQWNQLQKKKEEARRKGYELDEYSQ